MEISIIMPCYNASQYLQRCLDSLEKQTFKDFELIAINDLSTDNTLEILKEYQKCASYMINIISNKENSGPGISRNNGLDVAKGKYITFVDGDDYLDKNYLDYMYRTAIKEDADFVACGTYMIYPDGTLQTYSSNKFDLKGGLEALGYAENFQLNLATWCTLISKDIINNNNIRFNVGTFEDVYFNFRALYYCKHYVSIPDRLYYYYQDDKSISHQSDRKNYSYLEGFCKTLSIIKSFIDKIHTDDYITDEDQEKIAKFFFKLMMMKLDVSRLNMGEKDFYNRLNIYLNQYFGDLSIYIRTMLNKIIEQKNDIEKIKHIAVLYQKKFYLNMIMQKNVVVFGNAKTDIEKIKQININKQIIFINIYNNQTINLNICMDYMKEHTDKNNIYLMMIPSVYDQVKNIFIQHGYKEDDDFINANNLLNF